MRSRVAVSAAQGVETGVGERVIAEGRVLVTGQMRSGTTMLASFLNSQAEICMIPDALRIPAAALNTFGTSVGPSDLLDGGARKRLWRAMLHVSLNNPATPQVERTVIEAYRDKDVIPEFTSQAELYLRLLDDIARESPGFTWYGTKATRGEKLAASLTELGAKAIIILRDPRAVFTSQQARLKRDAAFVASDLEPFVEEWRDSYASWRASGEAVLALRYEDFVTKDTEFLRIADYLGVDIKPDAEILSLNTPFGDKLTKARRPDPVDRWREVGDARACDFIADALGAEMESAGYA